MYRGNRRSYRVGHNVCIGATDGRTGWDVWGSGVTVPSICNPKMRGQLHAATERASVGPRGTGLGVVAQKRIFTFAGNRMPAIQFPGNPYTVNL